MTRRPFVEVDPGPYVSWWQERFGVPRETLAGLRCYRRGRSTVWIGAADVGGMEASRTDAVGVPLLRVGSRAWKPTTTAIVALGSAATRNVLDLDAEEAGRFLAGDELRLDGSDRRLASVSDGYIVVRYSGVALGCGQWRQGVLESCVPKSRRIDGLVAKADVR